MADLPAERVTAGKPAFTYTGCDCFGPFQVKHGRGTIQRYGCMFSCFNTRAIHIEKLNTMEADSFINCFRRFIARSGTPQILYSDNGTNFVGAYNKMTRAHQEHFHAFLTGVPMELRFNPPKLRIKVVSGSAWCVLSDEYSQELWNKSLDSLMKFWVRCFAK